MTVLAWIAASLAAYGVVAALVFVAIPTAAGVIATQRARRDRPARHRSGGGRR